MTTLRDGSEFLVRFQFSFCVHELIKNLIKYLAFHFKFFNYVRESLFFREKKKRKKTRNINFILVYYRNN